MKSFIKFLGIFAFALLPILSSAALQSGKVQVGKVSGTVTLIDAKAQRQPLSDGATFQEGSLVETGINSTVELVFSNGASVVLTPNTLLQLRTFRQVPSDGITDPYRSIEKDPSPSVTELEVPRGKIIGEVRKLNALSTFTVKTPAGLVRIRGTIFTVEYRVGADGIGRIVVDCVRGSVETTVFSSNAGPVTVDPGTQLLSFVPSAALINRIVAQANGVAPAATKGAPAAPSAATLATVAKPVEVILYPIPAEDMAALAALLGADSTLVAEVAATISAMAQSMPTRTQIFTGGIGGRPNKTFGTVVTDMPPPPPKPKGDGLVGPATTTTGGSTTLDDTLKKITDNVDRTVEQKQVNGSGVGS